MDDILGHGDAVRFVDECERCGVPILGIEWFRKEGVSWIPLGIADYSGSGAPGTWRDARTLLADGLPDGADGVEFVTGAPVVAGGAGQASRRMDDLTGAHAKGLAAFLVPRFRAHFLRGLESEKQRAKLRNRLYHFADLDHRYALRLTSGNRNVDAILDALRQRGAPEDCYVLSSDTEIDGRVMPVEVALEATFSSSNGTFLSCIPGRLAYFEDEHGERHILERTTP